MNMKMMSMSQIIDASYYTCQIIFKCNKYIPASFAMLAFEALMETHLHYAKGK
jgi:hypothetical protein